jgi:hypothetical protein
MKSTRFIVAVMSAVTCSAAARAGIPEPDIILHGHVCIGGNPASDQDDVTVIAKATVASVVREVGRYKMGDLATASNCHGQDDCYVLRTRLESVPAGESPSGTAAVLDRANPFTVQVFLIQGEGAEQLVASFPAAQAGVIRRLDLRDTPATADLNGDGHTDLADYQAMRPSLLGPGIVPVTSCNPADLNGDGYVDMRDFAILQATFDGAGP